MRGENYVYSRRRRVSKKYGSQKIQKKEKRQSLKYKFLSTLSKINNQIFHVLRQNYVS